MNMEAIRAMARERGLRPGRAKKAELVRMIQRDEGSFDCYGSAVDGTCDQMDCLWREDCLRESGRAYA